MLVKFELDESSQTWCASSKIGQGSAIGYGATALGSLISVIDASQRLERAVAAMLLIGASCPGCGDKMHTTKIRSGLLHNEIASIEHECSGCDFIYHFTARHE